MTTVFQHLDDPVPLPPATSAQRQADIDRGAGLRRRRRAQVAAIPLAAALATAATIALSTASSRPVQDEPMAPAAPPTVQSSPEPTPDMGPPNTAEPAYYNCTDFIGDNAGEIDLSSVGMDRPAYPSIWFNWGSSRLPSEATVEVLLSATSADRERSRQLGVLIVDRTVEDQFVLDPATGERESLNPDALTDITEADGDLARAVGLDPEALGATWPAAPFMALGDDWTWTASITVDGTVNDVCDIYADPPSGEG